MNPLRFLMPLYSISFSSSVFLHTLAKQVWGIEHRTLISDFFPDIPWMFTHQIQINVNFLLYLLYFSWEASQKWHVWCMGGTELTLWAGWQTSVGVLVDVEQVWFWVSLCLTSSWTIIPCLVPSQSHGSSLGLGDMFRPIHMARTWCFKFPHLSIPCCCRLKYICPKTVGVSTMVEFSHILK